MRRALANCEAYILAGRVQVNGQVVSTLGVRVRPGQDVIRVDGRPIAAEPDWRKQRRLWKCLTFDQGVETVPVGEDVTPDRPQC